MSESSGSFAAVAIFAVATVMLAGCITTDDSPPTPFPSEFTEVDFEGERQIVSLEFSLYQATQDFDTSTYRVEDTDALRQLEDVLSLHGVRDYGPVLGDDDFVNTGGRVLTLEFVNLGGETFTVEARTSHDELDLELLDLTSEWHEAIPKLYTDDDIVSATVLHAHTQEETTVTDSEALSEFGALMRDYGILADYDSPLPLEQTPREMPEYGVSVELTGGGEIELYLIPDTPESAEFAQAAHSFVGSWLE